MKHITLPSNEEMSRLAIEDPEQLMEIRRNVIAEFIESVPEDKRQRLRGLQFRIDAEIKKHKNPVGACVAISKMMMESLGEMNEVFHGTHRSCQPREQTKATVINLFNNK